jgi:hypothetical protein
LLSNEEDWHLLIHDIENNLKSINRKERKDHLLRQLADSVVEKGAKFAKWRFGLTAI